MSSKKSFKIGEYAVGGIIQVELKGKLLSVKALDYYSKNEVVSGSILTDEYDAYWKTMNYLNELTSSYYADKIMEFIKSKTELNNRSNFL
jgi:hypothetical protein